MKMRFCVALVLTIGLGGLLAKPLFSEEGSDKGGGEPAMPPGMMKAPEHEELAKWVGKYDTVTKVWQEGGEAMESKGTAEFEAVMDGRYIKQDFKGEMMGQNFTGTGFTGYDSAAKKFESVWMDSMGTSITYFAGTSKDGGKTIESKGDMSDMEGGVMKVRMTTETKSADVYVMTMYGTMKDGKEHKFLEVTYTRKK